MSTKDVATQLGATGATVLIVNDGRTNPDLLGLNGPFLYIVGAEHLPRDGRAGREGGPGADADEAAGVAELAGRSGEDLRQPRRTSCRRALPRLDRGQARRSSASWRSSSACCSAWGSPTSRTRGGPGAAPVRSRAGSRHRRSTISSRPVGRRPPPSSRPAPEPGGPDGRAGHGSLPDERAEPARVRESPRTGAEPVAVPAQRQPEPVAVPVSVGKTVEPGVVRVPLKLNGRSRNNMRSRNR